MKSTTISTERLIAYNPEHSKQQHPIMKQLNSMVKSMAALLFTLAPLMSYGVWLHSFQPSDQRPVNNLAVIASAQAEPRLWDEPLVSVTFDDGWESIYSNGAPILEKYGIRSTQYILSGEFDDQQYLSKEQVLSLQKAGHDIQSHTVSHADLRTVDDPKLLREVAESKADLTRLTGREVTDFATPLNSHTPHNLEVIKQHYRSHRNTEVDINRRGQYDYNHRNNFNIYQIKAFSVERTTTTEQIVKYLEEAKRLNAWAVLVYHEVDENSPSQYAVTTAQLDAQMKAVKDSGIRTVTMDEVLDSYERQ
ncbi:polysaccharide deacetylase family protein [Candidatus Saccharibacteria bacterium]|nr:polysaccharide deacetylase family protein [Candidatus Saccharibacteria bacterium]